MSLAIQITIFAITYTVIQQHNRDNYNNSSTMVKVAVAMVVEEALKYMFFLSFRCISQKVHQILCLAHFMFYLILVLYYDLYLVS